MGELNLSRASLTSYLPHRKRVYFPNNCDIEQFSVGVERIRRVDRRENNKGIAWNSVMMAFEKAL